MQEAKKLYLYNPYFFLSKQKIGRINVTNCKNCGIFHPNVLAKIKLKAKLPLVSTLLCSVKLKHRNLCVIIINRKQQFNIYLLNCGNSS